jgi:hypothetical protein
MGFGNYTKEVLRPIAAEKPLLVTEFGANTVEADEKGQARLVRRLATRTSVPQKPLADEVGSRCMRPSVSRQA